MTPRINDSQESSGPASAAGEDLLGAAARLHRLCPACRGSGRVSVSWKSVPARAWAHGRARESACMGTRVHACRHEWQAWAGGVGSANACYRIIKIKLSVLSFISIFHNIYREGFGICINRQVSFRLLSQALRPKSLLSKPPSHIADGRIKMVHATRKP
jgi:hypothetical protein